MDDLPPTPDPESPGQPDGGSGGVDRDPADCEDPPVGPPVDLATLETCCPDYGGAHCVDSADVPGSLQPRLTTCGADQFCVPDPYIVDGTSHKPAACTSLGGADGVCLSGCIPEVGDIFEVLPQDLCAESERCAPCINPVDGSSTGACDVAPTCEDNGAADEPVDAGPATQVTRCCGDRGVCLAPDIVGERAADLGPDSCPAEGGDLCVPDVYVDPSYLPPACETGLLTVLFGEAHREGRCIPDCVPAVDNLLLGQDDCQAGYKCAPCIDPISKQPSGACDAP